MSTITSDNVDNVLDTFTKSAELEYRSLVEDIARGRSVEEDQAKQCLQFAGRSPDAMKADIATLTKRLEAVAAIERAESDAVTAEIDEANARATAALRKREQVEAEVKLKLEAAERESSEAQATASNLAEGHRTRAKVARQRLKNTADRSLLERADELEREARQRANQLEMNRNDAATQRAQEREQGVRRTKAEELREEALQRDFRKRQEQIDALLDEAKSLRERAKDPVAGMKWS
ncbi:hypothetical protein Pan216_16130 [Planctomycetes bacterium Pan216]|uniref:Chromosome partition protein Smc n=1 Tax=Kolteria novifilia TaxID=2527975 RepID=A0A518B1D3_9BACT|nr:hypothetical protein Pan216_16130 [Planctomycetes bacterium Pan216]